MDITQLILDDHHEQRRLFAILEEIDPADVPKLNLIWGRLAIFLELHAEAEERLFYPALLHHGEGAGSKEDAKAETKDAIKDHNEIRDGVAAVAKHQPGTEDWYKAVADANEANSKHMGEEEREALTDFRRHVPLQLRHDLAVSFAAFEAAHVNGVEPVDKSPESYIAANK